MCFFMRGRFFFYRFLYDNNENIMITKKIVLADGAVGTNILKVNKLMPPDKMSMTNPDELYNVHRDFIDAGAEIVTTNTFNCHPITLAKYNLANNIQELIKSSVTIAKMAANNGKIKVSGSIGATAIGLSRDMSFSKQLQNGFKKQFELFAENEVDYVTLETFYDSETLRVAIASYVELVIDIPLMVMCTVGANGNLYSGATMADFWKIVQPAQPYAVGVNCSSGVRSVLKPLELLAGVADCKIIARPNKVEGELWPEQMAELERSGVVDIMGGCCGVESCDIKRLGQLMR